MPAVRPRFHLPPCSKIRSHLLLRLRLSTLVGLGIPSTLVGLAPPLVVVVSARAEVKLGGAAHTRQPMAFATSIVVPEPAKIQRPAE